MWRANFVAAGADVLLARWQPAVASFMWMAFFPLWFLLAMPLLQLRGPGWQPLQRDSVRSANLVRRDVLPPAQQVGWILLGALCGLLLCVCVMGLALAVSSRRISGCWSSTSPPDSSCGSCTGACGVR